MVVVIAVIAILAAVLIPTFSSIIKKANTSADTQAVNTMNKYLAIEEVTGNKTIVDVYAALKEGGMTAKDYKPLATDTCFFWDRTLNRIVYTDKEFNVIYPTDLNATKNNGWYSLSGVIDEKSVTPSTSTDNNVTTTTYTVKTAEEFYWLANQINDGKVATTNLVIKLDTDVIDLMGADAAFPEITSGSVTLEGKSESKTIIKGLAAVKKGTLYGDNLFSQGLFGGTKGCSLTIKNIKVVDATAGDLETEATGILVGHVSPSSNVVIENCEISGGTVYGQNQVGGMIGQVQNATVNIKSCKIDGVKINVTEGQCGFAIGTIFNQSKVTLDKKFAEWTTNCTMTLVNGNVARTQYKKSDITCDDTWFTSCPDNAKFVLSTGSFVNKYVIFTDDAYATVLYGSVYGTNGSAYGTCVVKYGSESSYTDYYNGNDKYNDELSATANDNSISILTIAKFINE